MRDPVSWDIFCRVVDNFGDAGVCWRLARQLATEHRARVRLFIDELQSLAPLEPSIGFRDRQMIGGVEVWQWKETLGATTPADVVVEAFGCGLSDEYVSGMAAALRRPLWIVLEYLSAEPWVARHHGLPSPHPRRQLERYFFFPGFVDGTGGLLREADLVIRRDGFGAESREAFWRSVAHQTVPADAVTVSVFAYESAPVLELMRCWEAGARPTVAVIPESRLVPLVLRHLGSGSVPADRVLRRGALEVRFIPFLPQRRYDELLWACDVNFVRGEDSFVRAQWAARPFLWQVYPQQARAHWRKLDAFMGLYTAALGNELRTAVSAMMQSWNQIDVPGVTPAAAWSAYAAHLDTLTQHGRAWAERLEALGALTQNLASFCRDRLK